jgi:DNA-binding beta-propeller fold protein YncE
MSPLPIIRYPGLAGAIVSAALVLLGCGGSGGASPFVFGTETTSQLYVSGNGADSLRSYNNANTLSGSTAPNRVVNGGNTLLNEPRGIAVDMTRHQIYVANFSGNSILVFNSARTVSGDSAPARKFTGAATTLNGPSALFLDVFNDRLYIANTTDNSILVYNNASVASGNASPSRTLKGAAASLNSPSGVFVDTTRDKLYVINGGANSILVFDNAATVSGNAPPVRTIFGLSTTLNSPSSGALDVLQDRLYVANTASDSILVFNAISTISGNMPPNRKLEGALTGLNQSRDLYLDLGTDRLYVANTGADSVLVFNNAGIVTGNTAPSRTVVLTGGTTPYGIFVDVTPMVVGSSGNFDGEAGSDSSAISVGGAPRTGDVEDFFTSTAYRQFYSFDLSRIPAGTIVISATLRLYQASVVGSPYNGTLGSVIVDHVDYGTSLDGTDYGAATLLLGNVGTLSSDSSTGYKTLSVSSRVQNDLGNVRLRSQYRLRFSQLDANTNNQDDYAQFTDFEDSCCTVNRPPQLAIVVRP